MRSLRWKEKRADRRSEMLKNSEKGTHEADTSRIAWHKNTIDPVSSRENPFICSSSAAISAVRSNSGSFVGKIALIEDRVESLLRSLVETVSSDWLEVSV